MRLPFTHGQFLDVFGAYNGALWPGALVLWVVTVAALVLLARGRLGPRLAGGLLALHWAWSGIAYHLAFFAAINPAARLFGGLFVVEAGLLYWLGVGSRRMRVAWGARPHQLLSIVFCVYAVAYPLLAFASGLQWPRMPSFGVPCPTVLLTVGLLLGLAPRQERGLAVIPVVWCLVGGSAAVVLGVAPDLMLLVGAVVLTSYVVVPRALAGRATR
jgi:hypothetical protein